MSAPKINYVAPEKHYIFVNTNRSTTNLVVEVEKYILQGYEPIGGMIYDAKIGWYQTLYKKVNNPVLNGGKHKKTMKKRK